MSMSDAAATERPRLSMKERQWQLREDAILDAAIELLRTKGYNALTLEDITDAIGISRPTLYQHFKSKEDVFVHIAVRNMRRFMDLVNAIDPNLKPADRFREFIRRAVQWRYVDQGCPIYDLTRFKYTYTGDSSILQESERELTAVMVDLIRDAQECGALSKATRPELYKAAFIAMFKNLEIDRMLEEKELTVEEIEQSIVDIFFPLRNERE